MVVMEAVMAAMEVMADMEDMDTDVESEVPLLKLMPKPMPTMDMVVMAADMEGTVVVMVAVMAVMVDTDTAVNKKKISFLNTPLP